MSSGARNFKATWDDSGLMYVSINGQSNNGYNPYPSSDSNSYVVGQMSSKGAKLISTQWYGWVPSEGQCPGGDRGQLDSSTFRVKNVQVFGTVVHGPAPPLCSNPGPSPPEPTPGPKPSNCADIWKQCGGPNWNGATCCQGSCSCQYVNQWYSMCAPPGGQGNSCGSVDFSSRLFNSTRTLN